MKELIEAINKLRNSKIKKIVDARIREFKEIGNKSNIEIFKELCFCILTANFNAERSIKIQREIGDGFLTLPEFTLAKKLKDLGHRYYDVRAKYIVEARKYANSLKETINSFNDENKLREW
ncbi:MAG: N-glycosylase, partial [Nitrososphaerota archaeon]